MVGSHWEPYPETKFSINADHIQGVIFKMCRLQPKITPTILVLEICVWNQNVSRMVGNFRQAYCYLHISFYLATYVAQT